MTFKSKSLRIAACLAGLALAGGVWAAVRAQRGLVTLDVRDMEVRQVLRLIEQQTSESIFVHDQVRGNVTLNVRHRPLDEVLRAIGFQTSSRGNAIYPLYSNDKSLAAPKQCLRGELDPAEHGWTNLLGHSLLGVGIPSGGGPGSRNSPGASRLVSLQIQNKDVDFATLALARYAQVQVIPENGTSASVSFLLIHATVPETVAELAGKTHRRWTLLYTLRPQEALPDSHQMARL